MKFARTLHRLLTGTLVKGRGAVSDLQEDGRELVLECGCSCYYSVLRCCAIQGESRVLCVCVCLCEFQVCMCNALQELLELLLELMFYLISLKR